MSLIIAPIPVLSPLIQPPGPNERPTQTISEDYYRWLEQEIRLRLQSTPPVLVTKELTGQSAAIVATTLWSTTQSGLYRIGWYARITTPDAVSNSLAVTLSFSDGLVACSKTFTALTGITTATFDQNSVIVHVDAAAAIRYAVAYASNTPAAMKYRLNLSVEQVA